jgi:hypothetical protein
MTRKRRVFGPAFKAKVALAAVRGVIGRLKRDHLWALPGRSGNGMVDDR